MPLTTEQLKKAVGCLTIVFPEFVARELTELTDKAAATAQRFTDPISAIADLQLDSLINDAAELSSGDILDNMAAISAGGVGAGIAFGYNYYEDEISGILGSSTPGVSTLVSRDQRGGEAITSVYNTTTRDKRSKRIDQINGMKWAFSQNAYYATIAASTPFIAAQLMCETIVEVTNLKIANLNCLQKHITQLSNSIAVLIRNSENYKDSVFDDLKEASALLGKANDKLSISQRIEDGKFLFDANAFSAAQSFLVESVQVLNPPKSGVSVLDAINILTLNEAGGPYSTKDNLILAHISISWLIKIIRSEVEAIVSQIRLANYTIKALFVVLDDYLSIAESSDVREMRRLTIADLKRRITELQSQIDYAIKKNDARIAGGLVVIWSARIKSMIAVMDQIKEDAFKENTESDIGQIAYLRNRLDDLIIKLGSIESPDLFTKDGIEDTTSLRSSVLGLCAGAERLVRSLSSKNVSQNSLATFHALIANVATGQSSTIQNSISVAYQQQSYCRQYMELEIEGRDKYEKLISYATGLGLDRAADLLGVGKISLVFNTDIKGLSYLGAAVNCLGETMLDIEDTQTRSKLASIRDNMVARQKNEEIAAADSFDKGKVRILTSIKSTIATVQKNAKTVESIASELKRLYEEVEKNATALSTALNTGSETTDFRDEYDNYSPSTTKFGVSAGSPLTAAYKKYSSYLISDIHEC